MEKPVAKLPASQRTNYQFPVYRWIGWLAVAGFAIGLTMMFFIAGMFGVSAPLAWAFLVIVFTFGVMLLDRPKFLLATMMFYFMVMPSNRLFGLVGIPMPGFIDELFFLPLIAVIIMSWIQRQQLKEATIFPVAFCVIAALSWYVNGKPSPSTAVQVTLIMLKSYILWYFCRLTCTFESERQMSRWVWGYVIYAAVQFFYNILWQGAPWARINPDRSGGVFGSAGAYSPFVGYLSVFALMLLAGWWISKGARARTSRRTLAMLVTLIISYNLIFMTDTKHALVLMPIAFLPFLLHPKFSVKLRLWLISSGLVFMLAATVYIQSVIGGYKLNLFMRSFWGSPKGELVLAMTTDFSHLVPYPILGAGPGRFTSNQAVDARVPLARHYIIPYLDELRRTSYFGVEAAKAATILGDPQSDLFFVTGEYGWLGAFTYYLFLGWVIFKLWTKSVALPLGSLLSGYFMGLCCCLVFFAFMTSIMLLVRIPVLAFPLWILIGRMWDMKPDEPGAAEA
jgi:hypothetical protein